jgi:hypothetical protein
VALVGPAGDEAGGLAGGDLQPRRELIELDAVHLGDEQEAGDGGGCGVSGISG